MDTLWWSWDHSQVPGCPLHVLPPLYPSTLCLEMLPLFPSFTFEKLPLPTLLETFLKLSHTSSEVNRETFQTTSTLHSPLHSDWFRIRHVTPLEPMRCKQVVCGNDDQRLSLLLSQANWRVGTDAGAAAAILLPETRNGQCLVWKPCTRPEAAGPTGSTAAILSVVNVREFPLFQVLVTCPESILLNVVCWFPYFHVSLQKGDSAAGHAATCMWRVLHRNGWSVCSLLWAHCPTSPLTTFSFLGHLSLSCSALAFRELSGLIWQSVYQSASSASLLQQTPVPHPTHLCWDHWNLEPVPSISP